MLSPYQHGDVIYLISDGGDNASRIRANEIEEKLISAGVRLFAFLVLDPDPRSQLPLLEESIRTFEIVRRTGGAAFVLRPRAVHWSREYDLSAGGQTQLREAANSLYQQMEKFYLLEIELPQVMDKPRPWKLELIPDGKLPLKGLSLHYPMKLLPCSAAKGAQQAAPK